MIESIAEASPSSSNLLYALDRAGQAIGPSSLSASTDLDSVLADFKLPAEVLDHLRAPFEQLGFTVEDGTLQLEPHLPTPPSYTAARRDTLELALIQLPDFLFEPSTTATVFIGNGIGFTFSEGARLHLFAAEQDKPTQFLDKAMKSWTRGGVRAVFHPWGVISEFEAAADRAAFVMRVFEVPDPAAGSGVAPAAPATFTSEHRRLLHAGLVKAFPSYEALELMLSLDVNGRQIANIVPPTAVPYAVLKILTAAEAEGWLAELIQGARARNPGNPELRDAAAAIPAALGGEGP
jgi:hypothetical protein